MASLFPLISVPGSAGASGTNTLPLCRETDWNFQTNQPIWRGGNPVFVTGVRAVLIWAWNTLHTKRFAHDVYSGAYGPAFGELFGRPYTEEIRQAEAIRIVREALLVNPYIKGVTQIGVDFQAPALSLRFKLTTIYGEVRIDGCDIAL